MEGRKAIFVKEPGETHLTGEGYQWINAVVVEGIREKLEKEGNVRDLDILMYVKENTGEVYDAYRTVGLCGEELIITCGNLIKMLGSRISDNKELWRERRARGCVTGQRGKGRKRIDCYR